MPDSDSSGSSEVIFEDNGEFIETNLITEEDLQCYRLHVAKQEGLKGARLNEAMPAIELAKIIYKRRKIKEETLEVEEEAKDVEKLKDKIKKKKKKKKKEKSESPKRKRNYRGKTPSTSRSRSPKKRSHRRSRSKSRSRRRSRSRSRSRRHGRSRSREKRKSDRKSDRKSSRKSRSKHRGRRHGRRIWESKSKSRSKSRDRGKEDYIKRCRSVQDGPDLQRARPIDRRRKHRRHSSSSTERPSRGLPSSSSYLAIEGPESDKTLVTLYPGATPVAPPVTLDRVRLPQALAQQLFPVSCGNEHKTEEKVVAPVMAIEGAKPVGEEEKAEPPPSLSDIMAMRIEANKLLIKTPNDVAAKKILHEAQIMMNKWQALTMKNSDGRYTGRNLATPMPRELLDSGHPLAWARKDQFLNLKPITESPGAALMMKMGWAAGKGLGKEETGDVNPLQLFVKTDRKGLMTDNEVMKKNTGNDRANQVGCNWVLKIVNGKHAVSGLGEIHQHIGRPCPEFIDNPIPSLHITKVKTAWGQFAPPTPAINKKEGKGKAALFALQKIIAIEADKYNQRCPEESPTSGIMCVLFVPLKAGSANLAKYNAHFSNPNTNTKSLSQEEAAQEAAKPSHVPNCFPQLHPPAQERPHAFPHLKPPAQERPQGQSLSSSIDHLIATQRQAVSGMPPRAPLRACPLQGPPRAQPQGPPRAPLRQQPPSHGTRQPAPPGPSRAHLMRGNPPPGYLNSRMPPAPPQPGNQPPNHPPPRFQGGMPRQPHQQGGMPRQPHQPQRPGFGARMPQPRPGGVQVPHNMQQMIAMATRITGKNPGMPPPPRPGQGPRFSANNSPSARPS